VTSSASSTSTAAGASATPAASTLRARIVAAALAVTAEEGWPAVTMARLADAVGVSRQTVYNEVGAKPALAQAMVDAELARFLGAVEAAFDHEPDDLVSAVERAVRAVLELAADNALLRAIVAGSAGEELLPPLTTRSEPLVVAASSVVDARLDGYDLAVSGARRAAAVDTLVRVVLSHVVAPGGSPRRTAADLGEVAARLLLT
jgi:AcrR family transcriptional regulator